jgi:CDP-diacylglycerol--glycerol-3-phosphate 3-phosphatidyltransferase
MLANLITVGRVGLVFVAVALLYQRTLPAALIAFVLVLAAILMDALDGLLARRTHTDTPFGAVIDILGDRIVENTLWIVFAHLRLIPVWVPVVVVARGFVTDTFRSIALTQGETPFGEKTMIKSRLGRLLVTSRASRAIYAGAKVAAFCLVILHFADLQRLQASGSVASIWVLNRPLFGKVSFGGEALERASLALVYLTVALCLIRAIPVVQDGIAQVRQLRGARRG